MLYKKSISQFLEEYIETADLLIIQMRDLDTWYRTIEATLSKDGYAEDGRPFVTQKQIFDAKAKLYDMIASRKVTIMSLAKQGQMIQALQQLRDTTPQVDSEIREIKALGKIKSIE